MFTKTYYLPYVLCGHFALSTLSESCFKGGVFEVSFRHKNTEWLEVFIELRGVAWGRERLLFTMTPQSFTSRLRIVLHDIGMATKQAVKFTTHSFRRGAGNDA